MEPRKIKADVIKLDREAIEWIRERQRDSGKPLRVVVRELLTHVREFDEARRKGLSTL